MGRALIHYKQNDIRLTAVNFLTGAFLYLYLVGELTGGRSIYSYSGGSSVLILLFAGEVVLCIGSIFAAIYQRRYNRRLAGTNSGINRWYFSERTFDYMMTAVMFLIGWYLLTIPLTEMHSGLATGGLFFDNQRFADAPQTYYSLLYFHFALCIPSFVGAVCLLLFPSKKPSRTFAFEANIF